MYLNIYIYALLAIMPEQNVTEYPSQPVSPKSSIIATTSSSFEDVIHEIDGASEIFQDSIPSIMPLSIFVL